MFIMPLFLLIVLLFIRICRYVSVCLPNCTLTHTENPILGSGEKGYFSVSCGALVIILGEQAYNFGI